MKYENMLLKCGNPKRISIHNFQFCNQFLIKLRHTWDENWN